MISQREITLRLHRTDTQPMWEYLENIFCSFFQRHTLCVELTGICFFNDCFASHTVMMGSYSHGDVTLICYQLPFGPFFKECSICPSEVGSPVRFWHKRMSWGNTLMEDGPVESHFNWNRNYSLWSRKGPEMVQRTEFWPWLLNWVAEKISHLGASLF